MHKNKDDLNLLKKKYNLKQNIKLIKGGSGVDIKKLSTLKKKTNKNIVFSARLVKARNKRIY